MVVLSIGTTMVSPHYNCIYIWKISVSVSICGQSEIYNYNTSILGIAINLMTIITQFFSFCIIIPTADPEKVWPVIVGIIVSVLVVSSAAIAVSIAVYFIRRKIKQSSNMKVI